MARMALAIVAHGSSQAPIDSPIMVLENSLKNWWAAEHVMENW